MTDEECYQQQARNLNVVFVPWIYTASYGKRHPMNYFRNCAGLDYTLHRSISKTSEVMYFVWGTIEPNNKTNEFCSVIIIFHSPLETVPVTRNIIHIAGDRCSPIVPWKMSCMCGHFNLTMSGANKWPCLWPNVAPNGCVTFSANRARPKHHPANSRWFYNKSQEAKIKDLKV